MIRPPASLIARTIASGWIAWLVGIPCLFLSSFLLSAYPGKSNTLSGPLLALPFVGLATAGVVFPTCVGLGWPLFSLLPKNSILWRPLFATMIGVIAGPVAMFLMLTLLFDGRLDQVNVRGTFDAMMATSAIVGGSFAYVSARLNRCEVKAIAPRVSKLPRSLTSRSMIAATIAWLIGIVCLFFSSSLLSEWEGTFNILGQPSAELPFVVLVTAFVIFPTCVGLGLPLFIVLPKTSPLWRPFFATITGVILGPLAMLLLFVYLSDVHLGTFHQAMLGTSAVVGGSFAYVSARLHRRAERKAAASL